MPDVELMRDRFVVITRVALVVVVMGKGWKEWEDEWPPAWPRHTLYGSELSEREVETRRDR